MKRSAKVTIAGVSFALAMTLGGCVADAPAATIPEASPTIMSPRPASDLPAISAPPTPSQPTRSYDAEREAQYQADIASWPHSPPEGYTWPATWTNLPYIGPSREHDLYLTASGIYHCMMVGAAWDAYFADNDPEASKRFAALADEFSPDIEAALRVSNEDGTIQDGSLAAESGICRGLVGDLTD